METPSCSVKFNLPATGDTINYPTISELGGAVAPIPMGSEIKPYPSYDFMFQSSQSRTPCDS